jgi:hypothetical protein
MVSKRFTNYLIIFNAIMGLLLYFSSQLLLSSLNDATVSGYDIFSIAVVTAQVSGQVTHPIAWTIPNYPSYALLFFLIGNACLMILWAIKFHGKNLTVASYPG